MIFKRTESFRYTFATPIYCVVHKSNDEISDGEILDLSPNGLKLKSSNDIPFLSNLHITFGLNDSQINVTGSVRWKKEFAQSCTVGIMFYEDESIKRRIINELKLYVRRNRGVAS